MQKNSDCTASVCGPPVSHRLDFVAIVSRIFILAYSQPGPNVFLYLICTVFTINRAIRRPSDRSVKRPWAEIRTREGRIQQHYRPPHLTNETTTPHKRDHHTSLILPLVVIICCTIGDPQTVAIKSQKQAVWIRVKRPQSLLWGHGKEQITVRLQFFVWFKVFAAAGVYTLGPIYTLIHTTL